MTSNSGKSSKTGTNWCRDLREVQLKIESLSEAFQDTDLSHGMVLFLTPEFRGKSTDARIRAVRETLVDEFSCQLESGATLTHYIYAEHGEQDRAVSLKDAFSKNLGKVYSILASVPKRTLPSITIPSFGNGNQDRMAHWFCVLHFLGQLSDNRSFKSAIEFASESADVKGRLHFSPWEECSATVDFDPMDFLLHGCHLASRVQEWNERFESEGRQFPRALATSLTKPVIYASLNGIDKIVSRFNDQPKRQTASVAPAKSGDHPLYAETVLAGLAVHHGCDTDSPNYDPINQKDFAIMVNLNQTMVSRMIDYWMKKIKLHSKMRGSNKYKRLCKDEAIVVQLNYLRTPNSIREILISEMDKYDGGVHRESD